MGFRSSTSTNGTIGTNGVTWHSIGTLHCFGSWIKERGIFMCKVLVLVHALNIEVFSGVRCLFRFMD